MLRDRENRFEKLNYSSIFFFFGTVIIIFIWYQYFRIRNINTNIDSRYG